MIIFKMINFLVRRYYLLVFGRGSLMIKPPRRRPLGFIRHALISPPKDVCGEAVYDRDKNALSKTLTQCQKPPTFHT